MNPKRRVLVAAKHLALDRTSEGLSTARLVRALVESGHDVRCLTSERAEGQGHARREVSSTPGVSVVEVSARGSRIRRRVANAVDPARSSTSMGRRMRSWAALGVTIGTGLAPGSWNDVARWRRGIRQQRHVFTPDVVIVRGGGLGFEAHLAMAGDRRAGAWVAHYHDPYPLSAYPPSYAHHSPLISARQERAGRRILRRASIVTFPSDRLADWTERASGVDLGGRRGVLPHIGGEIGNEEPDSPLVDRLRGDRPFLLVHTGTLLPQRSPIPLLRAFRRFLDDGGERADQSRLVLLGSIDRRHRGDGEFLALRDDLETGGALAVVDGRTNHATALALARRATAAVLIEADDPESPFFPSKLADYLTAGLPLIALSPPRSVALDLLGADHPLWCPPGDEDAITAALHSLWSAWRDGRLDDFRPGRAARLTVSRTQGAIAAHEMVERALRQPIDVRWSLPTRRRRPDGPPCGDREVGSRS